MRACVRAYARTRVRVCVWEAGEGGGVSVSLSVIISVYGRGYFRVRSYSVWVLWAFFFMLSWMFQHDYLDTCCFECLLCTHFVFLNLQLFSAIEHVLFHMDRRSRNTLIISAFFTFHLGFVHPLQDAALHQWHPLSSLCCLLFQVVPSFLVMSSCHSLLGRPLDLFPLLGCHSVQRLVHFCFSVYSMI